MCGIAGYFNLDDRPGSAVVAERMARAIAYRGPDDEGVMTSGPVAVAHRRLSIIDLTDAARQPMSTADGRYTLVFNGEVYNFQELKLELAALGHLFRSRTDSEVVLEALAEWGTDALQRFNGMFALALWDNFEKRLLLARDRYGIKPLYWTQTGQAVVFGSEAKALLQHPDVSAEVDADGLVEYFTFQNFITPRTLFRGIELLESGCYLSVGLGQKPEITRWWDYNFREPDRPGDPREYTEELSRLFQQAVQRQLVSDVPVGSYLSGGIDSGSITAIAAAGREDFTTFTVGFDMNSISGIELSYDERPTAEYMSYLFGTEHYEMVLKSGDLERVMPRLALHIEEPRVGQSYPNFYAAQLASKFVKVCLSGAGGDELFGGYPWRYYRAVVNRDFEDYVDKYYGFWQRLVPDAELSTFLKPAWPDIEHRDPRELFASVFHDHEAVPSSPEDYVNKSLYFEAKTFLHGLLVVEDKLAMAHGLETRVPFLDNDLVDFAMQVPVGLKLENLEDVVRLDENSPGHKTDKYYQRTKDGKLILRQMMAKDYLPPEIVNREKQGFSAPDASWFKGESIDFVRKTVLGPNARIYDFLDRSTVERLVDEHLAGRTNRRLLIWSLLSFELWLETFVA